MAKWVDEGENRVLNILLGSTSVDGTLYLGLYTNSTEPAENATLSSLTEPSGYGYSRKSLARGTWSITSDAASYAQQVFTASGGSWGTLYGYFIGTSTDASGKLLSVCNFTSGPYTINDGDTIKVTPTITCA